MSTTQSHTVCCLPRKQGPLLQGKTSLTGGAGVGEEEKVEGQLHILGRVVSQFKELDGWPGGEGVYLCIL